MLTSPPPTAPVDRKVQPVGWVPASALVVLALVAGLNFTFAAAVMPNLAGVDDRTFVTITQRFNENPVFPASFTLALLLLGLAVRPLAGAARRWGVAALTLYGAVLLVTGAVHIPLNDAIDRPGDRSPAQLREAFETSWVTGNLVRTVLCVAALAALTRAIQLHGRQVETAGA